MDAALRHGTIEYSDWVVGRDSSFNPCFSGCRPATQRRAVGHPSRGNFCVSILVLVDAALRQRTSAAKTGMVKVSILVLVDAALRQYTLAE